MGTVQLFNDSIYFPLQYLACLSTSSSNDKLAFDVGLQEHSQGLYPQFKFLLTY